MFIVLDRQSGRAIFIPIAATPHDGKAREEEERNAQTRVGFVSDNWPSLTFLNVLSMMSNFFASSGSCDLMSPPTKIPSRYIHLRWTSIHTCTHMQNSLRVCLISSQSNSKCKVNIQVMALNIRHCASPAGRGSSVVGAPLRNLGRFI